MALVLFFVLTFFLGATPNAYMAGRLLKNIDIRQHGSGNVGATNVFRVLGRGPGIVVFLLDFLKGVLPVATFMLVFPQQTHHGLVALLIGLTAVLGHMFTPFLGFRGGKGIATGAGVVCVSFPVLFAVALFVWVVSFLIWRIVSVSSILAVCALFLFSLLARQPHEISLALFGVVILIFYSHRNNIKKLRKGQEQRLS